MVPETDADRAAATGNEQGGLSDVSRDQKIAVNGGPAGPRLPPLAGAMLNNCAPPPDFSICAHCGGTHGVDLTTRVLEAGFFTSFAAGRIGRRTSSPPQFAHT